MRVTDVEKVTCVRVETDEMGLYLRYGHDSWTVKMGESWEQEYFCEELEAAYQEYLKQDKEKCPEETDPLSERR